MVQDLGLYKDGYDMLKTTLRMIVLARVSTAQIFNDPVKNRSVLGLSLSLLLLIYASHGIWAGVHIAHAKISSINSNSNSMHVSVTFNDLLGLVKGNVLNLPNPFEHQIDIDAKQIFPNETLKREIISKQGPSEFTMPDLKYNLLGFNISATDIEVKANSTQTNGGENDQNKKTRIDFPVMLAKNVNVSNKATSQSFHNVDLSSIYAIYDPKTDKFTFHVPFSIAAKYLLKGS